MTNFEYCPRCGAHKHRVHAVCDDCGQDLHEFRQLVEAGAEAVLTVCGSGYGPGGAYSDTFHALAEGGERSVCGRLERVEGVAGPERGISWTRPILDLAGTRRWQSTPCGICDRMGAFDGHKERWDGG